MAKKSLKKLAELNELRIDNHKNFKRKPPLYYDSLRHAFKAYFETFYQLNSKYHLYAADPLGGIQRYFLDDENTTNSIILFERFFELFYKDLLYRVNPKLIYATKERFKKKDKVYELIESIESKKFKSHKHRGRNLVIPFRECLDRFYGLIELTNRNMDFPLVRKFNKLLGRFNFLDNDSHEESMRLLNWYRDRLLHKGNQLPTLAFLDYLITQKLVPIIIKIKEAEANQIGNSFFYLTTMSGIDILKEINDIEFSFEDLADPSMRKKINYKLLKIGHLKELGRASLNLHWFIRNSDWSYYEYNYRDFKGRGVRFAMAEKSHQDFHSIKECNCCGVKSLVCYKRFEENHLVMEGVVILKWAKCYSCNYYISSMVGDPFLFGFSQESLF